MDSRLWGRRPWTLASIAAGVHDNETDGFFERSDPELPYKPDWGEPAVSRRRENRPVQSNVAMIIQGREFALIGSAKPAHSVLS